MATVTDLWFTDEPDPGDSKKTIKVKTDKHGSGMRYKVRWNKPGGGQGSKSFADKRKREADAFAVEVENDLNQRNYIDPHIGKTAFKKVAADWIKGTSADPSSRNTTETQISQHILPFFESYAIARTGTVVAVRDWLEWVGERTYYGRRLDPSYVSQLFRQLSSILDMAVREKYITENPCRSKSITPPKVPKKVLIPWAKSKVDAIHEALPKRSKIVIPLGAGLGLRRGEMLAVDVGEDLDRDEGVLHVQRQIRRLSDGAVVFSLPKHDRTRSVPVADYVLKSIDAYVEAFPPISVTLPWKFADGPLVTAHVLMSREDKKTWYGELFHATVWRGAFRKAGIPMRRRIDGEHQLRHFYASVQLANLVSIRELADYLGHGDPALTLRTYTHLMPSSHARSRAAIDGVFGAVVDLGLSPECPDGGDGSEGPVVEPDSGIVDLD
jgi:integrase